MGQAGPMTWLSIVERAQRREKTTVRFQMGCWSRGGRVWTRVVVLVLEETWCPNGR